jgi:Anticodon binding domain
MSLLFIREAWDLLHASSRGDMTTSRYNLANLVPRNHYATQMRDILVALRSDFAQLPKSDFERRKLDEVLCSFAARHEVGSGDLFVMLRVVFEWPNTTPDLLDTLVQLGQTGCVRCLDRAITMLSDVAQQ